MEEKPSSPSLLVTVLHSYPDPGSTKAGFALLSLQGHMHTQKRSFQGVHVEGGRFWHQKKQDLKTDSSPTM